jgi:hypothetical protein
LENAEACIILADQFAARPVEEDLENIMRAVAIKNHYEGKTRILIQLLLERNKVHLLNIPYWSDKDVSVCLDEFKMGVIAQNCRAPGFATLLSVLLTVYGEQDEQKGGKSRKHLVIYETWLRYSFIVCCLTATLWPHQKMRQYGFIVFV